jgi:hypothetical protein
MPRRVLLTQLNRSEQFVLNITRVGPFVGLGAQMPQPTAGTDPQSTSAPTCSIVSLRNGRRRFPACWAGATSMTDSSYQIEPTFEKFLPGTPSTHLRHTFGTLRRDTQSQLAVGRLQTWRSDAETRFRRMHLCYVPFSDTPDYGCQALTSPASPSRLRASTHALEPGLVEGAGARGSRRPGVVNQYAVLGVHSARRSAKTAGPSNRRHSAAWLSA